VDYITSIHAAHHVDMNQGNYATLTMIYDWLFGTLETPVSRPTP
jgi:sterol desaturase/sphingolipid hydroxylase (fatty acid hydroxylase superfamily)